ncbi:MAG TPA: hydroxymethylglutaryl-CoA reductase (NADPH) [Candidatus Methanofastidiosa archaeon]|nr:hydroxymethylglutaryl-CoA reductase (NADPH) [Candidatus Methanofastidiosa archaeon]
MKDEEILQQLKEGKLKLYSLDKLLGSNRATDIRRMFIEEVSGAQCTQIAKNSFDFEKVCGKNAENTIGAAQIPMGIVGPIRVKGDHADGDYYVPLATSEGALIASTNRGGSVITQSGGSVACVVGDRMTRAPLFKVPDLHHSILLAKWVEDNFDEVRGISNAETRFTRLEGFRPYHAGRNLFLRFEFSTGDSMAMNSATKASDAIASFLESKFPWARLVSVSGNMCVDKKPSAINLVLGRGKSIVAEVLIPKDIVRDKLKTSADKMAEVCYRKIYVGSAMAGSLGGFNAHFANIAAAFFAATGQDLAHVVEASNGLTMMEESDGDLYASVTLPDVPLATFGAGTSLPTQSEALGILGLLGSGKDPGDNCKALAEIFASTILAGELSLIGALASKDLTKAHMSLGRSKR